MEGRGHLWEGEGCTCGRGTGALVGGRRGHLLEGEGEGDACTLVVTRLKLKGIDGRVPPGVEPAA